MRPYIQAEYDAVLADERSKVRVVFDGRKYNVQMLVNHWWYRSARWATVAILRPLDALYGSNEAHFDTQEEAQKAADCVAEQRASKIYGRRVLES